MGRYGWPNEDGVRGTRGATIELVAVCEEPGCEWDRTYGSIGASRVAARRHASGTRHVVAVTTTVLRRYVPEGRKR